MGLIYILCYEVFCFFGFEVEEYDVKVFCFFNMFCQDLEYFDMQGENFRLMLFKDKFYVDMVDELGDIIIFFWILVFYQCVYWSCVWIFQEIVFLFEILLIIGDYVCYVQDIERIIDWIWSKFINVIIYFNIVLEGVGIKVGKMVSSVFFDIEVNIWIIDIIIICRLRRFFNMNFYVLLSLLVLCIVV